jgi:tRNA pseudouridine32 synthase/23S rRNA pseudouridine746 synthase
MPDFIYCPPLKPYLPIVYQDEDLLVCDKPSGLLSVPGRELAHKDSLALRAMRVWPRVTVVHRLDMATSGIIVMAMHKPAQSHLSRQFQQRQPRKHYLAEIWGHPNEQQGEINLPLRCDWPNRPRQMVDFELGKSAQTHWQVLARREQTTLVELTPITGRSHQLRVHMLELGHPIVGDRLYAPPAARDCAPRLHLHAASLSLFHPTTEQWCTFTSAAEFAQLD